MISSYHIALLFKGLSEINTSVGTKDNTRNSLGEPQLVVLVDEDINILLTLLIEIAISLLQRVIFEGNEVQGSSELMLPQHIKILLYFS